MVSQALKIDLTEQFSPLSHAPIAEAVIEMRAQAEVPWEESGIRSQLAPLLPGYPKIESQSEFEHEMQFGPGQDTVQRHRDLGWRGLRCESADHVHIAQFGLTTIGRSFTPKQYGYGRFIGISRPHRGSSGSVFVSSTASNCRSMVLDRMTIYV
jgi:hypothetical protein